MVKILAKIAQQGHTHQKADLQNVQNVQVEHIQEMELLYVQNVQQEVILL